MSTNASDDHNHRPVLEVAPDGHRVTTLELFFDLVFVFAITQVTGYIAEHLTPTGMLEGLILLALIWWAWVAYSWLGTTIRFDEGLVRVLLFTAMGMMLVISMGLPEAFGDAPGGFDGWLSTPTTVALAYAVVRCLHLGLFAVAGRDDPEMAAAVRRFAAPVGVALTVLVVGSYVGGWAQIVLYSTAVVMDITGAYWGGGAGWALNPAHFVERHGLIVIIALGESIVAIGTGASALPLSLAISVTALLGLAVAACLWWVYFDFAALAAERNLMALEGSARNRAARDGYSVMHLPMIAGIVLLALGVKKTVAMVGTEPFDLTGHVKPLAAISLAAGVALYLIGHVLFRVRMDHSWSRPRTVAAAACAGLAVAAPFVPTMALLVAVTAVVVVLVNYEYRRLAWLSYHLRHEEGHGEEPGQGHEVQPEGDSHPGDSHGLQKS
jgi:low temperature requirement protein LtrA